MKRKLLKSGKEYKCEHCGNDGVWNNSPLSLHVDHVDGNHYNNNLDNLRFLCPNCHSQTNTFAGRNKKCMATGWRNITEDEWINAIKKEKSISGVIHSMGFNHRSTLVRLHVSEIKKKNNIDFINAPTILIQDIVNQLKTSQINFRKFGWVGPASKIIGIEPQKVGKWMHKNAFDFYQEQCFRRKIKSD
jgi:predicted RNA-binding Zn-ribbon protein involved in translation (DUF1610 family)